MEKFEPKMTDMEIVLELIHHIEEPCTTPELPGQSLRESHMQLARMSLPSITNPFAKKLLEDTIKKYEGAE